MLFSSSYETLRTFVRFDRYSSNEVLQKQLNKTAWTAYAGGMGVNIAMLAIPGAGGAVVRATSSSKRLNTLLRDNGPEELQRYNQRKLKEVGISKGLAKDFVRHAWLSPRHETIIADALSGLKNVQGIEAVVEMALTTESEEDALFIQRIAEIIRGYHDRVSPVRKIQLLKGLLTLYSANQSLVIPLLVDNGFWTEIAAARTAEFAQAQVKGEVVRKREVWITGQVSDRFKQELKARDIALHEHALTTLQPPEQQ